ncbi:MAG TPA: adenosylcobinamide-GDP ribazoletransferase [Firmicutes bacterium]|nr:adenosylcobinamide-GDP ribazoletransferase [Bacillota bacterium]
MRRLRTALSVLTVIPVGGKGPGAFPSPHDLPLSVPFFPLVGACLGLLLALLNHFLSKVLPAQLTAVLLVTLAWMLTGGIHLDGLADTVDGLASRAPAARALEVMHDPRVGAVGAAAAFLTILIKYASLAVLLPGPRTVVLLVMPVVGRQAMVTVMPFYRYAREGPGLAAPFAGEVSPGHAALALAVASLLLVVACLGYPRLGSPSWWGQGWAWGQAAWQQTAWPGAWEDLLETCTEPCVNWPRPSSYWEW